jgi:hypothetical protein
VLLPRNSARGADRLADVVEQIVLAESATMGGSRVRIGHPVAAAKQQKWVLCRGRMFEDVVASPPGGLRICIGV